MSKPKEGTCHLCGEFGPMTKEHIPPKAAFNDSTVFYGKLGENQSNGKLRWRDQQSQGGYHRPVLCKSCNNLTGHWYGAEYVSFCKAASINAIPDLAGKEVSITLPNLRPLRIIKQAMTIFCGTCGEGLSKAHPDLRRILLCEEARYLPDGLRVYLYLRSKEGMRTTGVAGQLRLSGQAFGSSKIVAEFSFWPVGWILAFDDQQTGQAQDVTRWSHFEADQTSNMTIDLPVHYTSTWFPMDFRSPDQVRKEALENMLRDEAEMAEEDK